MGSERKALLIYFTDSGLYNALTDAQLGALFRAMLAYAMTGEEPQGLDGLVAFAWAALKPHIDADAEHFEKVRAARAEAGKKGMASRWMQITNDNKNNK